MHADICYNDWYFDTMISDNIPQLVNMFRNRFTVNLMQRSWRGQNLSGKCTNTYKIPILRNFESISNHIRLELMSCLSEDLIIWLVPKLLTVVNHLIHFFIEISPKTDNSTIIEFHLLKIFPKQPQHRFDFVHEN